VFPISVEDLEEVPAHIDALLGAGRAIQRGGRPAWHVRQRVGQQALLKGVGNARERRVQPRVLDGDGRASAELLRQREVVVAQAAPRIGGDQRHQADGPRGDPHRHDHR
jgi:hypothetical protein